MSAEPAWDSAEFRCGRCGKREMAETSEQLVDAITQHRVSCGSAAVHPLLDTPNTITVHPHSRRDPS